MTKLRYLFISIILLSSSVLSYSQIEISDTSFINIRDLDPEIELDFVYADTTNFFKTQVYPCETCMLRYEVALALIDAQEEAKSLGYQLVLYDCYRPYDVQKFMWKVLPDSRYVANPTNGGASIHNRGGAVDVALADSKGNLIDMGTSFDHFGVEAGHNYTKLPQQVLENRKLLKSIMENHEFNSLSTEWWHYSYVKARSYPISNQPLPCK